VNAVPDTRYTRTDDGLSIAYQTVGSGPVDVVFVPPTHCIDLMWEEPSYARFLHRLARLGRLICLDSRGFGASDPVPLGALPTPETWMEDMRVVMDTVGSAAAHIVCIGASGFSGMLFAATYPERTRTLTLAESSARTMEADDYPAGTPRENVEAFADWDERHWGTGRTVQLWAPSRRDDPAFRRWLARFERHSASPATHGAQVRWVVSLDLRAVLPSIRVPTLVLQKEAGRIIDPAQGRYVADHIPGAQFETVPGTDLWYFTENPDDLADRLEEFITGKPPVAEPTRALATVLFTDIVGSTTSASELGDRRWTEILDEHDAIVDQELSRHRGRKVNPTGDGLLATFDGPARGVRCAHAICDRVRALGITVRAGLHTGEVELRGDDIGGIAVHIGQRISSLAGPSEVLVSRTVRDLVVGSGLDFEPRGERSLKGIPGTWEVYASCEGP
jgi:class 3 adenylate cyclase